MKLFLRFSINITFLWRYVYFHEEILRTEWNDFPN
jgi:hypothetical protein